MYIGLSSRMVYATNAIYTNVLITLLGLYDWQVTWIWATLLLQ
jgi:hypothetical protein